MSTEQKCAPKCPHCGETEEWMFEGYYLRSSNSHPNLDDLSDGDKVLCNACGEEFRFWQGEMVDQDSYHEYRSDSLAAERYEDAAHGDDREQYFESEPLRGGYRGDREDFGGDY